ncbi:hypothetical protein BYT27DRAFT_7105037 [Phlegmacium glaucopus]|nr:hypothetical protein BYT27DRAFT_7105037 [Phlegmacium glaucopus]
MNLSYYRSNTHQPRPRAPVAAYLMRMAPTPPPTQQDRAVAVANYLLDGGQLREEEESSADDENIDPQLRIQPQPQLQNQVAVAPAPVGNITVRLPLNNKVFRDIKFPADIPRQDFFDRICANMGLDRATAQLGWKSNDEAKRARAHDLATNNDVDNAFNAILKMKNNTRRQKEVYMEIIHLNPAPVEVAKKKNDGNRATDFAYGAELRMVQEKLRCAEHAGPNRWCYVSADTPNEHVALGYEEISLWARKIHDNDADPDCVTPPNCLRLDDLRQRASRVRKNTASKSSLPPIHVHINNAPLSDAKVNQAAGSSARGLKRGRSTISTVDSTDSDSDEEALPLSDVLDQLHHKFPQLNLPQYMPVLKQQGIVYAETVSDFDRDFYTGLGIAEGAVGRFMSGVKKILRCEKREKKHMRMYNKENSIEV